MTKGDRAVMQVTHWTSRRTRRWFANCDARDHADRRRSFVADYFEGYDLSTSGNGWIYICAVCMVAELGDRLAAALGERG